MELKVKPVTKKDETYYAIRELNNSAFPFIERIPLWMIYLKTKQNRLDFLAYFDEDKLIGFSYSSCLRKSAYLAYFAIDERMRGKGYGTRVMESIIGRYKDKTLLIDIEDLDEKAENYPQRLRRFEFYKRLGFNDTGYRLVNITGSESYMIMADSDDFKLSYFKRNLANTFFKLMILNLKYKKVEQK